jgi:quercetin dioxygenase-like cupin family protein
LCKRLQRSTIGRTFVERVRATKEVIMRHSRWIVTLVALLSLGVGFGLGSAVGQQSPPTDNKGLDAKVESTIDLAPDFPGYQLRLRTITFEPGGVAGFHSHKDRPAFAYVLQGTLTELRQGGYEKRVSPGEVITESRDVQHWAENRSGAKVVLVGVDIVKP